MGSIGDACDNAMRESFFASLECDLLDRRKLQTKAVARMAIFEFIEGWYNPGRRHSALGYLSLINHERTAHEPLESSSPQPSTKPGELQLQIIMNEDAFEAPLIRLPELPPWQGHPA